MQSIAWLLPILGLVYTQRAKLTNDTSDLSSFGRPMAMDGSTIVVGATPVGTGGSVHVFVNGPTGWARQTKIDNVFYNAAGAQRSLAIDGDTFIAGDASPTLKKAVIYHRSGTTWTKEASLSEDGAYFGKSVAISGSLAIVGAPSAKVGTNVGQGAAYVYARSGTTWSLQAKLTLPTGAANDHFGSSVAIRGTTAIVGAPDRSVKSAYQGAAYVFVQSGTTWPQTAELVTADKKCSQHFAAAVAMDGTRALFGCANGNAYVYANDGSGFKQEATLAPSTAITSLDAVALKGTHAALSSTNATFVFERSGTSWSELTKVSPVSLNEIALQGTLLAGGQSGGVLLYDYAHTNGDACGTLADCASNFCVDGFCCNTACAGAKCQACSNAATGLGDGVCGLVADGRDPRGDCAASGATCTGGTLNNEVCNGSGACRLNTKSCAPFMCTADGKGCASSCASDADCSALQYCADTKVCTTRKMRAETCTAGRECGSGFCVDGVCCDTKCEGQCQACAEPGKAGTCVAVEGTPRTPRMSCAGEAECQGACDGVNIASCSYPSAGRTCGSGCTGGKISVCDATGVCLPPSPCPGNFACDAPTDKCKTSCVTDTDCESPFVCGSGKCAPAPPPKCSDDGLSSISPGGTVTACTPYRCGSSGTCPTSCATSSDCVDGTVCDTTKGVGVCVTSGGGDEGGCAMGSPPRAGAFALGALVALFAAAGLRRRKAH